MPIRSRVVLSTNMSTVPMIPPPPLLLASGFSGSPSWTVGRPRPFFALAGDAVVAGVDVLAASVLLLGDLVDGRGVLDSGVLHRDCAVLGVVGHRPSLPPATQANREGRPSGLVDVVTIGAFGDPGPCDWYAADS